MEVMVAYWRARGSFVLKIDVACTALRKQHLNQTMDNAGSISAFISLFVILYGGERFERSREGIGFRGGCHGRGTGGRESVSEESGRMTALQCMLYFDGSGM